MPRGTRHPTKRSALKAGVRAVRASQRFYARREVPLLRGLTLSALPALIVISVSVLLALPLTPARAEVSCPNEAARAREIHGSALPDCRSYEQVSPVENEKGGVSVQGGPGDVQAARSGDRVRYYSTSPFGGCQDNDDSDFSNYVSSRAPGGTWATACVSPGMVGFSEDLLEAPIHPQPQTQFAGFAADEQQLIFESEEGLVGGAVAGAPNVYEENFEAPAGKQLSLVGLVPPVGHESCAGLGCEVSPAGAVAGAGSSHEMDAGAPQDHFHYTQSAISADGSRVFFTALPSGRIYLREDGQSTVQVSPGAAVFREATPDGEFVFYTEGEDLYRFDASTGSSEPVAVTATGTGDLSALAFGTGDLSWARGNVILTAGSTEVTKVELFKGAFVVGQTIEGQAIPPDTTITALDLETQTLTLSNPASATKETNVTAASEVVTGLSTGGGLFEVGQEIEGQGIPAHTTITALAPGELTLSNFPTSAGSGIAVTVGGSTEVSDLSTTAGSFEVGQPVSGRGIAPGTSIIARSAHTLTLSRAVTAAGTNVAVTASPAGVLGVLGASADASIVYFGAAGVLAENTRAYEYVNAQGEHEHGSEAAATEPPTEGEAVNLYEWYQPPTGSATTMFIARLYKSKLHSGFEERGEADELDWWGYREGEFPVEKTSRVTSDGQTLLFASHYSLTGYDNDSAARACAGIGACPEFFRYRAGPDGSVGRLACVSCNPNPAVSPLGPAQLTGEGGAIGETLFEQVLTRNLAEDGNRVLFQSPDPLVPGDTSDQTNVYEWEAPASGSETEKTENSCTPSSLSYYSSDEGCLFLISSGTSKEQSYFGDASANGDDVFFFTAQQLAPSDDDEAVDVYDASVNGEGCGTAGYEECHREAKPLPKCASAQECGLLPAEPPAESFPATASVFGPGNLISPPPPGETASAGKPPAKPLTNAQKLAKALKACRKDKHKSKRESCERTARKKYDAKTSVKRASRKAHR